MNSKRLLRLILLIVAATLWLTIGIGVHAQNSCETIDGNLLTNCGFEDGFRSVDDVKSRNVANGWEPWNAPRDEDAPSWQNVQPSYFASSDASSLGAIQRVREGGADAQVYFSYYETHDAGIYQQVSGIEPGTELRFSVYGYVLSTNLDDLNISEDPGGVALQVGIDPNGGTDPLADSVVYSDLAIFYDSFRQYPVIATAESDTVTVFVRTTVAEGVQYTYVYLDDAVLEITPESQEPTDEPTDEPTEVPTDTPEPTDEPTEVSTDTPEPTDEPTEVPTATLEPTEDTSNQVTEEPTEEVTEEPTDDPTPTREGTDEPTDEPTEVPTDTPEPTDEPTDEPTPTQDTVPTATPVAGGDDEPISDIFPGTILHTVQRGDTVGELAARYGSSIEAIAEANGLDDSYAIVRGQGLIIPVRIVPATETPSPTPVVVVVTATQAPDDGGDSGGDSNGDDGGNVVVTTYIVVRGDNLSGIARRFNTTVGTLVQLNGIANPNRIFPGQQLRIPASGTGGTVPTTPTEPPVQQTQAPGSGSVITYVVQPGDTLYTLAIRYRVTITALGTLNNIPNYNLIFVGQVLQIPT